MEKIVMTQEQIQDIQEKYKMNYKVEELCKIYGVGRKIIYKYTHGLKRYYQDKEWLIEHYHVQKMNKTEIAKMLNVDQLCIRENMKKLGIESDETIGRKRKYTFNKDYFENIDSSDKAYWLGFIMADGGIIYKKAEKSEYRLNILLARKDREHLEKFIKSIEADVLIKDDYTTLNGKRFPNSRVRINSLKMIEDLIKLGVTPSKKSNNEKIPNIDEKFLKDFIRGMFDGDGCISPYFDKNGKIVCSWCLVSSLEVCKFINDLFKDKFNINMTLIPDSSISKIETSTSSSINQIMEWLYEDPNCICLTRKKNVYLQFCYLQANHKI